MTIVHRLISAGFATAALASASVPAVAWTVWPAVDGEWIRDDYQDQVALYSRPASVASGPATSPEFQGSAVPAKPDLSRR